MLRAVYTGAGPLRSKDSRHVVLVEDDHSMRTAIQRLLGAAGYRVLAYASAEGFLRTSGTHQAACLVVDLHLPGLSGFDLIRKLEGTARAPVIVITGYDEQIARESAETLGAVAFLIKPFQGQDLIKAIRRALALGTRHLVSRPRARRTPG